MSVIGRLYHTVLHLRPRQIIYQVYYRLTGKLARNGAGRVGKKTPVNLGDGARVQAKSLEAMGDERGDQPTAPPDTFTYLNRRVHFPAGIDWNYAREGKLWTYHLNYCEDLRRLDYPPGLALIRDWIEGEAGHRDGWEPYPTSLRLGHWLNFFARHGRPLPSGVRASVRRQYESLRGKVEYHLGGNHLLENAIALTRTALFLGENERANRHAALLERELKSQYLPDGLHFERSPDYHFILLERLLDFYEHTASIGKGEVGPTEVILRSAPHLWDNLRNSLRRQLAWTHNFVTEDGRYAYFNDATPGMAPAPNELLARAARLGIHPHTDMRLGASGYHHWSSANIDVWIDAAPIGPDHLPGHGHADSLHFVVHLNGRPLLVDTAVSTYEKNARRAIERSTAAHNTVVVGGRNSSDVWAGFRVGKRARTTVLNAFGQTLAARHDGYASGYKRQFNLDAGQLTIIDELHPAAQGTAFFHFDHGVTVELNDGHLLFPGGKLTWDSAEAGLTTYLQATGWNRLCQASCLRIRFAGKLQTALIFEAGQAE